DTGGGGGGGWWGPPGGGAWAALDRGDRPDLHDAGRHVRGEQTLLYRPEDYAGAPTTRTTEFRPDRDGGAGPMLVGNPYASEHTVYRPGVDRAAPRTTEFRPDRDGGVGVQLIGDPAPPGPARVEAGPPPGAGGLDREAIQELQLHFALWQMQERAELAAELAEAERRLRSATNPNSIDTGKAIVDRLHQQLAAIDNPPRFIPDPDRPGLFRLDSNRNGGHAGPQPPAPPTTLREALGLPPEPDFRPQIKKDLDDLARGPVGQMVGGFGIGMIMAVNGVFDALAFFPEHMSAAYEIASDPLGPRAQAFALAQRELWEAARRDPLTGGMVLGQITAAFASGLGMEAAFARLFAARLVNCFPPDTLVGTADGLRPIGGIGPGDRVWGHDFATGEWRLCAVECRHDAEYDGPLVTLEADGGEVTATAFHPFWVVSGEDLDGRPTPRHLAADEDRGGAVAGRWVNSHEVRAGDVVYLRGGGPAVVRRVRRRDARTAVCNLTVGGLHTFAVGTAQALVHNVSGTAPAPRAGIIPFKAGSKLDLSGASVEFTKQTYTKGIGYVYILRDKITGEILKVGKTSGGVNIYERFNMYRRKSQQHGYEVEVEFWEAGSERAALDLEGEIRRGLKGHGFRLPWDKVANPDRNDYGLPWERSGTVYEIE
ncbi:MAG: hypothetical protein K2X82_10055, partial [Gemmataceae bacterium]|nr:hypothetical protein [Gemmataceae bacterium]